MTAESGQHKMLDEEERGEVTDLARETIAMCETVAENNEKGEDFANSVKGKIESMLEWSEKNSKMTEKMASSIRNMNGAVQKWMPKDN